MNDVKRNGWSESPTGVYTPRGCESETTVRAGRACSKSSILTNKLMEDAIKQQAINVWNTLPLRKYNEVKCLVQLCGIDTREIIHLDCGATMTVISPSSCYCPACETVVAVVMKPKEPK